MSPTVMQWIGVAMVALLVSGLAALLYALKREKERKQ